MALVKCNTIAAIVAMRAIRRVCPERVKNTMMLPASVKESAEISLTTTHRIRVKDCMAPMFSPMSEPIRW